MDMGFIRKVDRLLGPPACQALLPFELLAKRFRQPASCRPKRILIMEFFGIGSVLLASPAMRELKNAVPEARIGIFTTGECGELCGALPWIDRAHCLDASSLASLASS